MILTRHLAYYLFARKFSSEGSRGREVFWDGLQHGAIGQSHLITIIGLRLGRIR